MEAQRLPVGQQLPGAPRRPIGLAVDADLEARLHHRFDGRDPAPGRGLVEDLVGAIDPEIVRQVEGVKDQRAVHPRALEPQVEITERNGMGDRPRRRQEEHGEREPWTRPAHERPMLPYGGPA